LLRGGRLLKRWRYVAVFGEQLMACAARVQIGPTRQAFWAVYLRERSLLRERTHMLFGRDRVLLTHKAVRVADAGVLLELALGEAAHVQAHCVNDGGEVWTRKQAGNAAVGTLALDGCAAIPIVAQAVIDDTAGYHPRHTEWRWSAGVGRSGDGRALAWNLVSGINDPSAGSERAVWMGGMPHECPPVHFSTDLRAIECEDGATLSFSPEAERRRKDNFLIVSSDYHAPFGTFSGTLPGPPGSAPIALADGRGVVEHHRARW
jgi:hypothetical protein